VHLGHDPLELLVVGGDGTFQEREVVARLLGDVDEGPGVLREAAAAPARTGLEVFEADAAVVAEAEDHIPHVGTHRFAQAGDGVHEAQLGRQEGVGGVLDRLRGGRVGDEQRCLGAGEQLSHPGGRRLVVGANHVRSGCRLSGTAVPSLRNSGFDTTLTSVRPSTRSTTRVEPTGTVDLLTITVPGARWGLISAATASTYERSADPSSPCGVGTHRKTNSAPVTAAAAP